MARWAGMAGRGGGAGRLGVVVAVAVLGLLSGSAMAVEVVNLPTPPPSGGPNNGGHFRFGTVSWNKLQHQPPKIRFTVEAAFRRTYAATNFRGCPPAPRAPPPTSTLRASTRVEGDQSSLSDALPFPGPSGRVLVHSG